MRRLLFTICLLAACSSSTAPTWRYDGVYALTSPLPYSHTLNGTTYNVQSETLYVYLSDGAFERHYLAPGIVAVCCGSVSVSRDSIFFGGQGTDDAEMLDAGHLDGQTLTVRAANSVAILPWAFVYRKVR